MANRATEARGEPAETPLAGSGPGGGAGPPAESTDDGMFGFSGTTGPSGGSGGSGADESGTVSHRRRRRVLLRVLIAAVGGIVVLTAAGVGLAFERQSAYNDNITRVPGALPTGDRPAVAPGAAGAQNWLLVGSDTRATGGTTGKGANGWKYGAQRSDTMMLVHLPADRKKAYVISLPRDSWVEVPGHGRQKINAAFSYGGPNLTIRTVESLTGVRIDHYAAIDFEGFRDMVDAVGDIQVTLDRAVVDPMHQKSWKAGVNTLDGERAMWFVRQRYGLPNGDFDRIKRQQAVLSALAKKAASSGTLTNPLRLNGFLDAFTKSITVDDSVTVGRLRSLALSLRGLRTSDVSFMTLPHAGSSMQDGQSVVLLDEVKDKVLFSAVRQDTMPGYLNSVGGAEQLGSVS